MKEQGLAGIFLFIKGGRFPYRKRPSRPRLGPLTCGPWPLPWGWMSLSTEHFLTISRFGHSEAGWPSPVLQSAGGFVGLVDYGAGFSGASVLSTGDSRVLRQIGGRRGVGHGGVGGWTEWWPCFPQSTGLAASVHEGAVHAISSAVSRTGLFCRPGLPQPPALCGTPIVPCGALWIVCFVAVTTVTCSEGGEEGMLGVLTCAEKITS